MPTPGPFHSRQAPLVESAEWRNWAGRLAPIAYEPTHEAEYFAIRNAVALIDVSMLYKYEISGPEAEAWVDRIITRDVRKLQVGQVYYTPWCDEDGRVIDDGTVARLSKDRFRLTAADPNYRWFQAVGDGFEGEIADVGDALVALALQGPRSREVLAQVLRGGDIARLGYFRLLEGEIAGLPVTVTRTGYTGDLGYEIWAPASGADALWDALFSAGGPYGLLPTGLAALDIARIEAGLLLLDVDYNSSRRAVLTSQMSSPFEIGLGWAVALDKPDFIGRRALRAEKARGSEWVLHGVELDWPSVERAFAEANLPPKLAGRANRSSVPIYCGSTQIGRMTSHVFSPILKRYIGLASFLSHHAHLGQEIEVEVTVEHARRRAKGRIVPLPFFDPPRKKGKQ